MQNVTMEAVAKAAGVSRALVSLAYRDAYGVNPETRDHILAIGKKLGYRPNRVAAQLAGKKPLSIGIFLQDLHNSLFADVFDGIRSITDPTGKHTVITVGSLDGSKDIDALETLLENRVDVVIAAGLTAPDAALRRYTKRIPIVSVMRQVGGADNIVSDNFAGAFMATSHLIALGHQNVAFMSNPPSDGYLDRRQGYESAMANAGFAPLVIPASYSRTEVCTVAVRLLTAKDRPSAVFAHNDQAALGVLDAALAVDLKPGVDIAVVGYDNSSLSNAPSTALTTVDVHGFDLGRLAAEAALMRLENADAPCQLLQLTPSLVVRASSGGGLPPLNNRGV